VLSVAGCGGSAEEPMIRKFFQSSAMGDNLTLANIATVSFDPTKDGRASNVKFVSETEPVTRVLNIKALEEARKQAQDEDAAFSKKMKEYQDKNLEAIERVLKAERTNGKVSGKDAEVQAAWSKWREDQSATVKHVSEARTKLQAERRVADLSVPDHDVTAFEATEVTKEVTVTANVTTPNGQKENKTMVLTLQKVTLKDAAGKAIEGRWFITQLKEAPKASS
jgi:hypothetical protein